MRILLTAIVSAFAVSAAHAQSDTTIRTKIGGITNVGKRSTVNSIDTLDIESVEVVKGAAAATIYGGQLTAEDRRKTLAAFELQRETWRVVRPRIYLIRVFESGCIRVNVRQRRGDPLLRDQLIVRDTTIIRRQPAPINQSNQHTCGWERTVDGLFVDIAAALADSTAGVFSIKYDEVYGFPRSYTVFSRFNTHGRRVLVESFAPMR